MILRVTASFRAHLDLSSVHDNTRRVTVRGFRNRGALVKTLIPRMTRRRQHMVRQFGGTTVMAPSVLLFFFLFLLLPSSEWSSFGLREASAEAHPRGFTEDPFITEERFRENVATKEVVGVLGDKALIPCELTAPFPTDSPHLILFYKDGFGTPIYSYDLRQPSGPLQWRDNRTAGGRSSFRFRETGITSETGAKVIESFLVVEPLREGDGGIYRCRVDFREAPTRNTRIKLQLIIPPSPPVILSDSGRVLLDATDYVREGVIATLVCESMGGAPLPRLTWWKGKNIVDDVIEEVDAAESRVRNSVRLVDLKREDHGAKITCKATNSNLTQPAETSVRINMVFPPVRAKIVREWLFFSVGLAYNVSCQVLGSRPPAATSVFVGNSQLREVNYRVSPDGNVSTTTVIFIPSEADAGKFLSCRAENMKLAGSAVEDQWKIQVHYAPTVTLHMSSNKGSGGSVREGETIQLKCIIDANPKVHTIQWIYEGSLLDAAKLKDEDNVVLSEDTLTLARVRAHQKGEYRCRAANKMGEGQSNPIRLDVRSVPSCANPGGSRMAVVPAKLQETVELRCTMAANPRRGLEFRWAFNSSSTSSRRRRDDDDDVDDDDNDNDDDSEDLIDIPRSQFSEHGFKSILTYTAHTRLDYGTVICAATNEVGESQDDGMCVFKIVPAGKPEGLKNCTTVNQTYESLTISCQPGFSGGEEQSFILEVYDATSRLMMLNITTNKPTFYIRGLNAATEYFVEIFAANARGRSERTLFETFTLQPAEKQLAATTTELSGDANSAFRLLPILGALVSLLLLLVLLAVLAGLVVRSRKNSGNGSNNRPISSSHSSNTSINNGGMNTMTRSGTHVSFNNTLEEEMLMMAASPDVVPQGYPQDRGSKYYDLPATKNGTLEHQRRKQQQQYQQQHQQQQQYQLLVKSESSEGKRQLVAASNPLNSLRRGTKLNDGYQQQQPHLQYVELSFAANNGQSSRRQLNNGGSGGGSVVGVADRNTLYATIAGSSQQQHLVHSPNCPLKGNASSSSCSSSVPAPLPSSSLTSSSEASTTPSPSFLQQQHVRSSGSLKRVAFKEDHHRQPLLAKASEDTSTGSSSTFSQQQQGPKGILTKGGGHGVGGIMHQHHPQQQGDQGYPSPPESICSSSNTSSNFQPVAALSPLPAPPPGYESTPSSSDQGLASTNRSTQPSSVLNCNSLRRGRHQHSQAQQCSPVKDVESTL